MLDTSLHFSRTHQALFCKCLAFCTFQGTFFAVFNAVQHSPGTFYQFERFQFKKAWQPGWLWSSAQVPKFPTFHTSAQPAKGWPGPSEDKSSSANTQWQTTTEKENMRQTDANCKAWGHLGVIEVICALSTWFFEWVIRRNSCLWFWKRCKFHW